MNDDRSPLRSLLAGDEEIGEIILLYAGEMPGRADRVRVALDARNWQELQEVSHQIKGSAGSHGFPTISAVAAELNLLLKTQSPEPQIIEAAEKLIDQCLRATGEPEP